MTREKAKIIDAVCITLIACLIVFTVVFAFAMKMSYAASAGELFAEAYEAGYTAARKDELKRYYGGEAVTDRYIASHIRIEGTVEPEVIATVLYELDKVPNLVMENFIAEGGKIVINNKNFPSRELSISAIGFYNDGDKYIEIDGSCVENIENALLHEIGHYIDFSRPDTYDFEDVEHTEILEDGVVLNYTVRNLLSSVKRWSEEEEWIKCYELEKAAFAEFVSNPDYHTGSTSEYFAEAFEWYINNAEFLFDNCYETAHYVMRHSYG